MGLIFNTKKSEPSDYSSMNHLAPEMKVQIVNAQSLVDKARKTMKEKGYDFDLTAKMQLRDDCKAVEKIIKEIGKGKTDSKQLELAVIRLNTTLNGLLNFF